MYSASGLTVIPQARELFKSLVEFKERHAVSLPVLARRAVESFIFTHQHGKTFEKDYGGTHGGVFLVGLLASVRTEIKYHLTDREFKIQRVTERAFVHLQRSIVADPSVRQKWNAAFGGLRAEEACEKLGAVHLLLHGIWAFKAHAAKGRTDLIMSRPLQVDEAQAAADALVLTEWKVVRAGDDPLAKAEEAKHQAERYSSETLAGFELASRRYLVLVSKDWLHPVPRVESPTGRQYDVRVIAVDPASPSEDAFEAASRGS